LESRTKNILIVTSALVWVGVLYVYAIKKPNSVSSSRGGSRPNSSSLVPETADPEISKKFNFHLIPDGKNNYRAAQLTETELAYVIRKYGIKHIIRLNGNGSDSKHRSSYPETSESKESSICQANGCQYHRISSHEGYVSGKGYQQSVAKVGAILDKGNTLIHCAHGADRTGGLVGGYLKSRGYMTDLERLWSYTTQYNGWNGMIAKCRTYGVSVEPSCCRMRSRPSGCRGCGCFWGSGFDKYADCFYPITELKRKKA